jgi:hypothetical protein
MQEQTGPRHYRIVVGGQLGEQLAAAFGEFELAFKAGESSLSSSVQDQAQLHGLRRCGYSPDTSHTLSSRYSSRPLL